MEQRSAKKTIFNLDEERSFRIKISMGGTTNLPNTKPIARFVVAEADEKGLAVMLPATPTEYGVRVTVPPMKNIFSEEKEYIGKLEIIFGNRYFSPMTLSMQFVRGPEITAEADFDDEVNENLEELKETFLPEAEKTVTEKKDSLSLADFKELLAVKNEKTLVAPVQNRQQTANETKEKEDSLKEKKTILLSKMREWLK